MKPRQACGSEHSPGGEPETHGGQPAIMPHIRLRPGQLPAVALLPGDPARLDHIAHFLDGVAEVASNREFRTIQGAYQGLPVAATSTGIGGPSAAIAVEELARVGVRTMIRVGSAGALQPGLSPGDLVVPVAAVREDGASRTYVPDGYPAAAHPEVLAAILAAAAELGLAVRPGITRSHDSFYTDDEPAVTAAWHRRGVLASDMETAALFVVGSLRGVRCGSILNVVVPFGDAPEEGIGHLVDAEEQVYRGEDNEIRLALTALSRMAGTQGRA